MAFNLLDTKKSDLLTDTKRSDFIETFFDRLFNELYSLNPQSVRQEGNSMPPRIDVAETDSTYYIDTELPGINQKDLELKIENNLLTIKGKREQKEEQKGRDYYVRENCYGSFQRSITIPSNIDSDSILAKLENGVLHIEIAKKEQTTAKKIEVMV